MTDEQVNLTDDELRAAVREGVLNDPAVLNRLDSDSRRRLTKIQAEPATSPTQPPSEPDLSQESAPVRFMGGVASVLNPVPFARSLRADPAGTARGMWDAQVEQFKKAGAAPTLSEQVGYSVAGALPILGPAAARAGETIGAGQDIAGGLGQAAGLLAPFKTAREAVGVPVRGAVRLLPNRLADLADSMAQERIVDVTAPKVGREKLRHTQTARRVMPSTLREPGMGALSRQGFERKIGEKFDAAAEGLDAAQDARLASQQVEIKPLLDEMDAQLRDLVAQPIEASHRMPAYVGDAVREVPVNPLRQYALQWMLDDMVAFPFEKKQFDYNTRGQGGSPNVTAGHSGGRLYRYIVGSEGQEVIHATRGEVGQAIRDVMAGNTNGTLRQEIVKVADELAADKIGQGVMETPPAPPDQALATDQTHVLDMRGVPTEKPAQQGVPMGRAVVPEPNVDQATALRQIRDELAALGDIAPYESVRRIRNAWDKVARIKYNASFVQDFLKKQEQATGAAKGTAAMRDALAKTSPETAQANADFALRKAQRDVLQATAETEQGRPIRGTRAFSRGAGMLEGGRQGGVEGAIIGTLVGDLMDRLATSGVTPKIYTARLLTQLADAIRGNQPARAASLRVKLARIATTGEGAAGAAGGASTPRAAGQPQEEERRARR